MIEIFRRTLLALIYRRRRSTRPMLPYFPSTIIGLYFSKLSFGCQRPIALLRCLLFFYPPSWVVLPRLPKLTRCQCYARVVLWSAWSAYQFGNWEHSLTRCISFKWIGWWKYYWSNFIIWRFNISLWISDGLQWFDRRSRNVVPIYDNTTFIC